MRRLFQKINNPRSLTISIFSARGNSAYDISPGGIDLSKRSFDRMLVRFDRLYEQGADNRVRLVKYVQLWIKWARSGGSLDVEQLKLKTTQILQNTFNVRLPLQSI